VLGRKSCVNRFVDANIISVYFDEFFRAPNVLFIYVRSCCNSTTVTNYKLFLYYAIRYVVAISLVDFSVQRLHAIYDILINKQKATID